MGTSGQAEWEEVRLCLGLVVQKIGLILPTRVLTIVGLPV